MSNKDIIDIEDRLNQILESINLIQERSRIIKDSDDFLTSPFGVFIFDACVMRLQIIGENVKKIIDIEDNPFKDYINIPWKAIISLRNIISHEYSSVDEGIIFSVIKDNLPELKNVIVEISRKSIK